MATFYLLPPRPIVARQFAHFLKGCFPGLDWNAVNAGELAEALAAVTSLRPEVFVVFREDLPEGVELSQALKEDFGAEPGDQFVEGASPAKPLAA